MPRPSRRKIGVIGLGIIGRAVTENLRRKGFQVFVWNRTPRPVPNFVGSPAELAGICGYIQIFVSDDQALLETVRQLSDGLSSKNLVVVHSTVAPDSMRAAAEIVKQRGARFVEAPFTGSKIAAGKGELVYYVGGDEAAMRDAHTVLEASGKEAIHIGEIGQATLVKIATNMVTAASVQATAEALALVQRSGLSWEKFVQAMQSNASHSITLAMKISKMIERDFSPHFSVKHMLKDVRLANELAVSHDLELAVTAAARDQLLEQVEQGHADHDYSAVAQAYLRDEKTKTTEEQPESISKAIPAPETAPTVEQASSDVESNVATSNTGPTMQGQLRRGFLGQLIHRARHLGKRSVDLTKEG